MKAQLQSVRVDTGGPDEEGQLVFVDERLVAVLVQLSEQHDDATGQWFLEHGFGRFGGPAQRIFNDLEAVERWFEDHYTSR